MFHHGSPASGLPDPAFVAPGAILGFDYNRTLMTSWFEIMVKPFAIDGQITSEHPNQSMPGVLTRLLTGKWRVSSPLG